MKPPAARDDDGTTTQFLRARFSARDGVSYVVGVGHTERAARQTHGQRMLGAEVLVQAPLPCTYCWALGLGLAGVVLALLQPVISPKTEPLDTPESVAARGGLKVRQREGSALLAGSFNPPHKGHVAMLAHLSKRYAKVFAVVGFNPAKKYAVTPEQRCAVLKTMVSHLANVEPITVRGYIWRFAFAQRVVAIYRGIRDWKQDGRAEMLLELQNRLGPPLLGLRWPYATTFLCLSDPKHGTNIEKSVLNVSSTDVRSRLANHEDIEDLIENDTAVAQIKECWGPISPQKEKARPCAQAANDQNVRKKHA